jgi:NADH:ubiquinone oxidoreductase subunit K
MTYQESRFSTKLFTCFIITVKQNDVAITHDIAVTYYRPLGKLNITAKYYILNMMKVMLSYFS